jgi:hypothetical protein
MARYTAHDSRSGHDDRLAAKGGHDSRDLSAAFPPAFSLSDQKTLMATEMLNEMV